MNGALNLRIPYAIKLVRHRWEDNIRMDLTEICIILVTRKAHQSVIPASGQHAEFQLSQIFSEVADTNLHLPKSLAIQSISFPHVLPFFLPNMLCDPTDLIRRKGIPLEAMTGRRAPSSDCLLAEVFWDFPRL